MSDNNKIYSFSKKIEQNRRVDLTVEELAGNVKQLVSDAYNKPFNQPADCPLLVGRKVRQKFIEDGAVVHYIGITFPRYFNVK